jgi:hypothetical protein
MNARGQTDDGDGDGDDGHWPTSTFSIGDMDPMCIVKTLLARLATAATHLSGSVNADDEGVGVK